MFNLLRDPWLPARRAGGQIDRIRPAEITGDIDNNPVVAIEWPRPDFRIACIEFLIGLIATACPPADDEDGWIEGWHNPPSPEALSAALAPIAHAFDLDGPGPRFLQDFDELPGEPDTPETLLIEAPGANTRRNNTALLVKAGRIECLSRSAAAMALFTLQCYAPQGGSGHRTSLRGGGPLTTLVLPKSDPSLWKLLWANVPTGRAPSETDLTRVLPWLAPTRTADRFPETTPITAHRLQAFWGMPRRIRLEFRENVGGRRCDLTGDIDDVIVVGWRQQKNGVKYTAWDHPLSPSYKDTKGNGWITQLAKSGIGYRDWAALAIGDEDGMRRPASCISKWRSRSADVLEARKQSRFLAGGFHMVNNMKARAFVESEMPLPGANRDAAETLAVVARRLVDAAGITAAALRDAVRQARYRPDSKIDKNSAPLAALYESFWAETHDRFFALLPNNSVDGWEAALDSAAEPWRISLRSTALRLFDEAAPLDPSAVSRDPKRIVGARHTLLKTLEGRGPAGANLFKALNLAAPEPKAKRRRQAAAMEPA